MPFVAVLESQASPTEVWPTVVAWRFGGADGAEVVGGGGVVVEHGAVAAERGETAERFCALSDASTPSV